MNRTPIVVAFTPNYFIPAATAILSVLEHSPKDEGFHFICLLSEPMPDDLVNRLALLDGGTGRLTYEWFELKEELLEGVYIDPKYTIAASFRLVVADLFPQYDKLIYMDCDVIIRQDLAKLYRELDLGNNYLAGVVEASTPYQIKGIERIGAKVGAYINSGFLVMNLALLRQDKMSQKFIEALKVDYLEFPDQDVLNTVCLGRILALPPYYNGIRTFMQEEAKENFLKYYTEEDWQMIDKEGTIHYTGQKPWRAYTIKFEYWWATYFRLPKALRQGLEVDKKMIALYRLFSLPLVRPSFNFINRFRRKYLK